MNFLAKQSFESLRKMPVQMASLLTGYRNEVAKINADPRLSDQGKVEKQSGVSGRYKVSLYQIKKDMDADVSTIREKLTAARPDVSGVEGEMKHSRLFNRVQAQLSNGTKLDDLIKSADRDTLDVIRQEAPFYFPGDNDWVQKLATQRDRQLMPDNEREAAEALETLDTGLTRLQMGVSQTESELAGTGDATFVPAFDSDGQGINLLPSYQSA